MEEDRSVLKLCSVLFSYPEESIQHNQEITSFIQSLKDKEIKMELEQFMDYVNALSYKELCESYVREFDFSDQTTLDLTYGIFGEKRERGLGFIKLKMELAKAGYFIKEDHLPDYLPLILEFASVADSKFVEKVYLIHKKGFHLLYENLEKKESAFQGVLKVCIRVLKKLSQQEEKISNKGAVKYDVKEGTV